MLKTIAIITEKGIPSKEIKENTLINVFSLDGDKVSGYESIKLERRDNNYFSRLLKLKKISLIYIDTINNDLRHLLHKVGIGIKCKEEWGDDLFIRQFIFI